MTHGNHESLPFQKTYIYNITDAQFIMPNSTLGLSKFFSVYLQDVVIVNFDPVDEYFGVNKTNALYEFLVSEFTKVEKLR